MRGLLGHARIGATQVYAQGRPARLKQAVGLYEGKALEALTKRTGLLSPCLKNFGKFLKLGGQNSTVRHAIAFLNRDLRAC